MSDYKTYDDLFYGAWKKAWAPENILPGILHPKFEELGVYLTDEQLVHIVGEMERGDGSINFEIDDDQYLKAGLSPDENGKYNLAVDLTDEVERLEKKLPEVMAETFLKLSEEWATELYESIEHTKLKRLKEERDNREAFLSAVWDTWGEALDDLDVFINLATEAGDDFVREYRASDTDKPDYKFQALIGLHARACQIGKEILTLLWGGFADGAHARWRSLHEVAVVGKFIFDHEQDTAERYLLHRAVEAKKGAYEHAKHAERLNEPPPTENELAQLDAAYKSLEDRFGKPYLKPYGWAANRFQESPNFSDIEEKTGLDHFRPYYKLASYNVHASAQSILYRLGENPKLPLLIAGPSVFGLADPGHGAALSLFLITVWLLTYQPTIDRSVRLQVLMKMRDKIGEAFYQAHWLLLDGEAEPGSDEEE